MRYVGRLEGIKLYLFMLIIFLVSNHASAAKLEDVKILSYKEGEANFKLKMQLRDAPKGSFFYVDVVKSDSRSFEKLILVLRKLTEREKFKLDMDIPSFTSSPSGSYYRSDGILFHGVVNTNSGERNKNKK